MPSPVSVQTAAKPILVDGKAGFRVVSSATLPAALFPVTDSWNQERLVLDDPDNKIPGILHDLQRNQIYGLKPDKDGVIASVAPDMGRQFLELNANALRSHANARLWTTTERYYLSPRLDTGGSLIVARFRLDETTTSKPLLCFTGPSASFPPGDGFNLQDLTPVAPDPTMLRTEMDQPYPPAVMPLAFSLASASRSWTGASDVKGAFSSVLERSQLVATPDGRSALAVIPVVDRSDKLFKYFDTSPDDPFHRLNLWIPDKWDAATGKPVPDADTFRVLSTGAVPPCPVQAPALWPLPEAAAPPSHPSVLASSTPTLATPIILNDAPPPVPPSEQDVKSGTLLVPRFLRFPPDAGLPVGFIIDPTDLAIDDVFALLAYVCFGSDLAELNWFISPLTEAWLRAAIQQPDSFAFTLEPYASVSSPILRIESIPRPIREAFLHLEWLIVHQILSDAALATCSAAMHSKLLKFMSILSADASAPDPTLGRPLLGWTATFRQNPYILRLRPPRTKDWHTKFNWDAYYVDDSAFPCRIHGLHLLTTGVPGKEEPLPAPRPVSRAPPPGEKPPTDGPATVTPQEEPATPQQQAQQPGPHPDSYFKAMASMLDEQGLSHKTIEASPLKRHLFDAFNDVATPAAKKKGVSFTDKVHDLTAEDRATAPTVHQGSSLGSARPGIFDPLANHAAPISFASEHPWAIPAAYPGGAPLPVLPASSPPAELQALLHFTTAAARSLPGPDSKSETTRLLFHPDLLNRPDLPTREILRSAAMFGMFVLPPTVQVHLNHDGQRLRYDPENMLAPGYISGEFLARMTAAFGKSPTSAASKSLQSWFRQEVRTAGRHTANDGPVCNFDPAFFTEHVMQAIIAFDFRSGLHLETEADFKDGFLCPLHFLLSIPKFADNPIPRIPANGLFANVLADICYNIFFFFHCAFNDWALTASVGQGHSTFSRWSPFGGHLLFLARLFSDRAFHAAWGGLSQPNRLRGTLAAFHALNALFKIFEDLRKPRHATSVTFTKGFVNGLHQVYLVLPCLSHRQDLVKDRLAQWRSQVSASFDPARLRVRLPDDGFYAIPSPACILPKPKDDPDKDKDRHRQRRQPLPDASTSSQRDRQSNPSRPSGESRRASRPLIQLVHGATYRPVAGLVATHNRSRSSDRITIPQFPEDLVPHARRRAPCFHFITKDSGCRHTNCDYVHWDVGDSVNPPLPPAFARDLCQFLDHPAIRPVFQPTQALQNFQRNH